MTFKINRSNNEEQPWFFTIISDNHKVIAVSELYHNLNDALDTIKAIRSGAATADLLVNNDQKINPPFSQE